MNYIKDVALKNDDETLNVIVEILVDTDDKNELVQPNFNKLVCVRKVNGKYPFYYGSFPQTLAGDKDPLDMILFTDKKHNLLDLVRVDVIGAVKTLDAGEQDDKIICVESDCGLMNVKRQMKKAMKFLKSYKGKNADMKIDKKLVSMVGAEKLVDEANRNYIDSLKPKSINTTVSTIASSSQSTTITNNNNSRIKIIRR